MIYNLKIKENDLSITTTHTIKIGKNKGKSRLWLEGTKLLNFGFSPDTKYNLFLDDIDGEINLLATNTDFKTNKKVSRRKKDNCPIIDLSNNEITSFLNRHFPNEKRVLVKMSQSKITFTKEVK